MSAVRCGVFIPDISFWGSNHRKKPFVSGKRDIEGTTILMFAAKYITVKGFYYVCVMRECHERELKAECLTCLVSMFIVVGHIV